MAVAQFLGEYYSALDLEEFFLLFFWPALGNMIEKVVGDNYWYDPGVEANLDVQYIMSMGLDVPTWFFSTTGYHQNQVSKLTRIQIKNDKSRIQIKNDRECKLNQIKNYNREIKNPN